jgi:hypothetical protein
MFGNYTVSTRNTAPRLHSIVRTSSIDKKHHNRWQTAIYLVTIFFFRSGSLASRQPSPTWRTRFLVLMSPTDKMAQLYPRGMGLSLGHLLGLSGLPWRYSKPPPHGILKRIQSTYYKKFFWKVLHDDKRCYCWKIRLLAESVLSASNACALVVSLTSVAVCACVILSSCLVANGSICIQRMRTHSLVNFRCCMRMRYPFQLSCCEP